MIVYLSIAIGIAALLFALPVIPGIERARLALVLLALGSSQIHLAVAAYGLFMIAESRWRLEPGISGRGWIWGLTILLGIGLTSAVAPSSDRMLIELAQMAIYVILGLLTLNYIRTGEELLRFLEAAVIAALAMTVLGLLSVFLGLQAIPHIFIGRGSNEGAVFLALVGAVPAAVLFVRSRRPFYLIAIALFAYAQYIATARGSIVVTGMVALSAFYFATSKTFIRVVLVLIGVYILFASIPILNSLYESNLNFSTRERLALFKYGWWLWEQRPITGWGWGSTTMLAQRASTTVLVYPHFHNAYSQLIVEAGVVGWAIIVTFFAVIIRQSYLALVRYRYSALSMLIVASGLAMAVSGMFDAMLYGADRAIQVVILMSLMQRAVRLAAAETATHWAAPPLAPDVSDTPVAPLRRAET